MSRTVVLDVQGRANYDRIKKVASNGPRAHLVTTHAPSAHGTDVPPAAHGAAVSGETARAHVVSVPPPSVSVVSASAGFDQFDFNKLTPTQLDEVHQIWQARQPGLSSSTRLRGKPLSFSWIIDTGASRHMSGCLSHFTNIRKISPLSVGLPNGELAHATQCGDIHLSTLFILRNFLYSDKLHCNLISVSSLLLDSSLTIQFSHLLCFIQDRFSKMMIGAGEQVEGLYYLTEVRDSKTHVLTVAVSDTNELWHRRLRNPFSNISSFLPF
ncbi:hypothetical protein RND81_02G134900 [Saponaria officinalis]|uniref:Retrovirus-related Pol polyprotein from transposon TNT 1-94-like beta-barrel domain-containing protein n=1 Tax=Saponaria officinalis TaxID=3572 RepID=A0AAW1MQB6_SAPOF